MSDLRYCDLLGTGRVACLLALLGCVDEIQPLPGAVEDETTIGTGECAGKEEFTPCGPLRSDEDSCIEPTACLQGRCTVLPPIQCNDENACTTDRCAGTECLHTPNTEAVCDDGNRCFTGDFCSEGRCRSGSIPLECSDGDPCTADTCDPDIGCSPEGTSIFGPCDDGDACTLSDYCDGESCIAGSFRRCDDGNPCTADSCYRDQGCVFTPVMGLCDDGNPCTAFDSCSAGRCLGSDYVCEPCAGDADCAVLPQTNYCFGQLRCVAGQCLIDPASAVTCPTSSSPCQVSGCNPATGACVDTNLPELTACSTGQMCTVGNVCTAGVCGGGLPVVCRDDNPCTAESCVEGKGCVFTPGDERECDDQNPCTVGDRCFGGQCMSGPNTCEACQNDYDCMAHLPKNACTGIWRCIDGGCAPAGPPNCDGSQDSMCSENTCNLETGACESVLAPDGTPCEDFDMCTLGDQCLGGVCVGGARRECVASTAPCVVHECDGDTGGCYPRSAGPLCPGGDQCKWNGQGFACAATGAPCPVAGPPPACSDGNACTTGDTCSEFGCAAGEVNVCSEICDNGLDDDLDGWVDCNDANCDNCTDVCYEIGRITCGQSVLMRRLDFNANRITEWPCSDDDFGGPERAVLVSLPCAGTVSVKAVPPPIDGMAGGTVGLFAMPGPPLSCQAKRCQVGESGPSANTVAASFTTNRASTWWVVIDTSGGTPGDVLLETSCECFNP